jgi:hypothetical protein
VLSPELRVLASLGRDAIVQRRRLQCHPKQMSSQTFQWLVSHVFQHNHSPCCLLGRWMQGQERVQKGSHSRLHPSIEFGDQNNYHQDLVS